MNQRHMLTDQSATISSINFGDNLGLRIKELRQVPGTELTVIGRHPLHDPIKLHINGQALTLRNKEADHIKLTAAIWGKR